jgi:hypothetical protein
MVEAVRMSMRETTQSAPLRQTAAVGRQAHGIIKPVHFYKTSEGPMSKNPRHFIQPALRVWVLMFVAWLPAHAANEAKAGNGLPSVFLQALKKCTTRY